MGEATLVSAGQSGPVVRVQGFCKRYRKQVAVALGMSERTLYRKLKRYHLN